MSPEHTRPRIETPVPLLLRKIVFRILLGSALCCSVTTIPALHLSWGYVANMIPYLTMLAVSIAIFLHHTFRLRPRSWWLVICELIYSCIELACVGYVTSLQKTQVQYSLHVIQAGAPLIFWFILAAACFVTFIFLFCDIVRVVQEAGSNILHPYNWLTGCCCPDERSPFWRLIFGGFLLRKRFSTDNWLILLVRAMFATICLLALAILAFYILIGQPLEAASKLAVKTSKISQKLGTADLAHPDLAPLLDASKLQVILAFSEVRSLPQIGISESVVNATMVSDPHPSDPSTFVESLACNETKIWNLEDHLAMTTCDYRWFDYVESTDILVAVNFSRIPPAVDASLKTGVYIGMADSVDDVLASTSPLYLSPGARLHGVYQISIQERITNRRVAALGVAKYRGFVVTSVHSLFPDTISPILADNNTATLRVSIVLPAEVPVEQEYYEKSVFNGFALLGGIWTIVNGLFAGMFGSTLLLVLFGVKPLSIYGFVHSVQPRKISLVDGQDVQPISPEERDRIVRIIREHLLDVDDDTNTTQPRSDLEAASDDHQNNSATPMAGGTDQGEPEKVNPEQENLLSMEYATRT